MGGKVDLPFFQEPPQKLNELWTGEDRDSILFQDNCRVLNNAICLSSVAVQERRAVGYNPNIVFQGRVVQRIGSVQAEPGAQPRFAQLYMLDPSLETTTRYANMTLPGDLNNQEKETMKIEETVEDCARGDP